MFKYVLKRLLYLIPVLVGTSLIVFTLLYFTPGDPAKMILGEQAEQQEIEALREDLGLNDPFFAQYGKYLWKIVSKGDIGTSYNSGIPVLKEILTVFPNTIKLAVTAVLIGVTLGIIFGIITAIKQYSIIDSIVSVMALVGISMPSFWIGILMILLFSVRMGWLPPSGLDSSKALIMPAIALSTNTLAIITRMTRSSMLEVIQMDFIKTARAKGQSEAVIVLRHAFKNALIPVITVIGLQFGYLLGGAIIVESIFSIPGLGRLMIDSIKTRDFPIVQGCVLFMAVMFSMVNLGVDLLYTFVDPRLRKR